MPNPERVNLILELRFVSYEHPGAYPATLEVEQLQACTDYIFQWQLQA